MPGETRTEASENWVASPKVTPGERALIPGRRPT